MVRLKAVLNPSGAEFSKSWEDSVNLANVSLLGRQALMTLGLALADIRGDAPWLERGCQLLSAGTWNLWDAMSPSDRTNVRPLLSETHRLWGWPADPAGEPGPFTGPIASRSDYRILDSDWRTRTQESVDKAINGAFQRGWERRLSLATRRYPHLQILAPEQTPAMLAAAHEAVAGALVRAWYLKLHVLPVVGDADRGNSSDRTRDRRLALPYGYFSFEQAAQQIMNHREQARLAYRKAEVPLRASLDAGSRCIFAAALAWIEEIASVCESALAARLPWDQAAATIYSMRAVDLSQMLEEMRGQTSRATLQMVNGVQRTLTEAAAESSPDGPATPSETDVAIEPAHKGKDINGRMMKKLQEDKVNCFSWTVREWANHLQCSVSTVQGTKTWEIILNARKLSEAERVTRRKKSKSTDGRRFGKRRSNKS
jgi:hypothetical protein